MHACGCLKVRHKLKQYKPTVEKELPISVSAIICSMGAEANWGFDRTVTKKYGCKDFAYDPTSVLCYAISVLYTSPRIVPLSCFTGIVIKFKLRYVVRPLQNKSPNMIVFCVK